jgi:hypothetical protein
MRVFEQIMERVSERVAAGLGLRDLPPAEYVHTKVLRGQKGQAGALDPRSPFMPWLIKQIKNGHFDYSGHVNTALNHAKNGDYDTADTYIDFANHYWRHPGTSYTLRQPFQAHDGEHITDIEDLMPYLRRYHRMAQRDPNYNLNALNPKGVINSLKVLQRERAANYGKVVHDFGNGWTMRKLRNKEEAEWEGAQMANCIAEYGDDIQHGAAHIWSLRDPKNKPKVSIEMVPRGNNEWGIQQMYEKANNSDIRPQYKEALRQWFAKLQAKGQKIHGADVHYIRTPEDLNRPHVDDYGLPSPPYLDARSFYENLTHPNGTWEYNPERIDAALQGVHAQLGENDMYDLLRHNREHENRLLELRSFVPPETWREVQASPYAQAVGHLQQRAIMNEGGAFDQPDPAVHVFAHTDPQEHLNPYGEPCTCPWNRGNLHATFAG